MPHKWCKEIWRYILFWWPKRSFVPCNVVNPNQNNPGPNTRIYMTLDGPWAWSPCENGWQMDYASFGNFIDLLNDSLNSISRLLFFWLYREIWIYMGIPILIQSLVNLDFDLALVSGSPSSSLSRVCILLLWKPGLCWNIIGSWGTQFFWDEPGLWPMSQHVFDQIWPSTFQLREPNFVPQCQPMRFQASTNARPIQNLKL